MKVSLVKRSKICISAKNNMFIVFTVILTNYVLFIDKQVLFHSYKEM